MNYIRDLRSQFKISIVFVILFSKFFVYLNIGMEQNTDAEQANCFLNYLGCVSQGKKKVTGKDLKIYTRKLL